MHRPASRASRKLFVLSLLLSLAAPAGIWAADEVSTWQCLPEETAFAVRIPNGKAVADAFVKNTKLGAVLFSEKRRAVLAQALSKSNSDEWALVQQKLSEYGLTTDELLQFFAGESGYAVVVTKDGEDKPLALGLSWLEPGSELAEKAYGVLARVIEEQEGAEQSIGRVDLELAGRPVMQLMIPHVSTEHARRIETPEGYDQMSEEEQNAAREEAYKKWEESAVEKTNYGALLVSTVDDRILVAHGYRQHESQEGHPDAEPLAETFTRLLAEHAKGEGGFVSKYADDPGVSRIASLEGVGAFEVLGDVAALLPLARSAWGSSEMVEKIVRIAGLDSLGPFAARSTLEDTQWHGQFSLAVSQPRQGIMKWLDQTPQETEPPEWAPANATTYSQFSFDLGKAYAVLKEEVSREFPEQAGQYFSLAEMQVVGFAQVGLEELLSSLGTRHVVLTFEAPTDAAITAEGKIAESNAAVWQVTDEQLWARVFKAVAPLAGTIPGGEMVDEQGYSGIRFKNDRAEGGLLLGNGNLVLAIGPQVLETMISALNNPPKGAGAFRGGAIYQQAVEVMEAGPSIAYKVVDGNRYAAIFRSWMIEFLKMQQESAGTDDEDANEDAFWIGVMTELMPTEEEMKDLLGVMASRWEVGDHGLFSESVQEMPPPEGR